MARESARAAVAADEAAALVYLREHHPDLYEQATGEPAVEKPRRALNVGVHASHCCARHGCKYDDQDCPVAAGTVAQDHPCEICSLVDEQVAEALRDATVEQLRGELARREGDGEQ